MRTLLLALLLAPAALAADVSGFAYAKDGSPVAGATVRAGETKVTTNAEGAFTVREVAEGVVELVVEKDGIGRVRPLVLSGDVVSVTLDGVVDHPSPLPSSKKGEGTVAGRVTLDGKPLANAPVMVGRARVTTNAKGQYTATGLPAEWLPVRLDERLSPRIRMEENHADLRTSGEATVDLELKAAAMIRGRVVDANDKPVARARVELVVADRSRLEGDSARNAERTTLDGRFFFPAPDWISDEEVTVAATPALRSTARSKPFTLAENRGDIVVRLPATATVRIRVQDRARKPIPGARVAFPASEDAAFGSAELLVREEFTPDVARTDAEGVLVAELAPDSYELIAAAGGFQARTQTVTVAKAMTVELTLERAAALRGRVHRGGTGVRNVTIRVLGEMNPNRPAFAATDSDGRFELDGLAPGAYRLFVSAETGLISRTLEVQAPDDLDIELPPSGKLRARVFDAATGAPVRQFMVAVEPADGDPDSADGDNVNRSYSSDDGTSVLELSAGNYRVSAGSSGYASIQDRPVRVVENQLTVIDLALGRGAGIRGRVTDERGAPVAGASVTFAGSDEERGAARSRVHTGPANTATAADGTFALTGIEPGEAELSVRTPGFLAWQRTLDPAQTTAVEVRLSRGLSISGIVTRGGQPAAGAQIGASTSGIGGEHQPAVSGDDGRFTLSGLVPAPYIVRAILDRDNAEVEVDPTRQREVTISLDPTAKAVVYGTVTGIPPAGEGGKSLRRVVTVYGSKGGTEGTIDDAGNYRIENAPVGTAMVAAYVETSSRSGSVSPRKQVELSAGGELRVDLDLGGSVRVNGHVSVDGKPAMGASVIFASESGAIASMATREDGSYELTLAAPGRYFIQASTDQHNERSVKSSREIHGGESIDIDLRSQVIEGTVVDAATRQPIADAMVTLALADGAPMPILAEVATDRNGGFRIEAASAGTTRLIAAAQGYGHRTIPLSGAGGPYTFALSPVPDLRVRVLDARTGSPLDAYVLILDAAGIVDGRPRRSPDRTAYLFSLTPGQYKVMVIVERSQPKTVDVTAPGAVDITVD